jgi:hypothetical protein
LRRRLGLRTVPPSEPAHSTYGGLPQAHAAILAPTGQPRPIGTPRHLTDSSCLLVTNPQASVRHHLPHLHHTLIASAGQQPPVRAPRHPIEVVVDMIKVPQEMHTGSRGRVPQSNGIVPRATGKQPPIGTPRQPMHDPAMAAQHPGRLLVGHLPDRHEHIRAATGAVDAIRTPVQSLQQTG